MSHSVFTCTDLEYQVTVFIDAINKGVTAEGLSCHLSSTQYNCRWGYWSKIIVDDLQKNYCPSGYHMKQYIM